MSVSLEDIGNRVTALEGVQNMPIIFPRKVLLTSLDSGGATVQTCYLDYATPGTSFLVTAEISPYRHGSGSDGVHFYFTSDPSSSDTAYFYGIPAIFGYVNNVVDIGGSANVPGIGNSTLGTTMLRNTAQAFVTNGLIRLVAYLKGDDYYYVNFIISVQKCVDGGSASFNQAAFYR